MVKPALEAGWGGAMNDTSIKRTRESSCANRKGEKEEFWRFLPHLPAPTPGEAKGG
jgi:hypothetical protein